MKHQLEVTYNNDDDGIHVQCLDCEYHKHVGWYVTVLDLEEIQDEHLDETGE
jgi:hypothetical protein